MATLEEPVDIPVDSATIAGTFVTPGTLVPGVLFVHGWGGCQQQYLARARDVAGLGCICLAFDLRGHAQTHRQFDTVSRADNLQDVLSAYDALVKRRHVDPSAVAVIGSSYGGYLGSILTTLRPVKWLALRAPALYVDTGWDLPKLQLHRDQDLRAYRRQLVHADNNRALQAIHGFEGDVLLVESEQDSIVPKTVLTSYRDAATRARSLTYRCLDGADHGLIAEADQRAYSSVLLAWMKEMLLGARRGPVDSPDTRGHNEAAERPEAPPKTAMVA
jgi:uncharacterized protein